MNPEKIGKQIIKRILMEEEMTKVSLYPGAFKPPHKGHVEVALRSIDDKTDKVIVFLSTKEREGVDIEQAKKVWDLYKANIPELEKIEIHPTPTPVKAVYDYAKDNPAHDIRAVFGKGEEDRFKSLLDKEKYPHVEVFDAGVVDDFSATTLRKAIKDNDLETIEDYIPYLINVDDFLSIFKTYSLKEDKEIELDDKEQEIVNDILSNVSEGATATRVIDKFKDYSRKGLLTMSIVLGVMQGLEAQNTVQSDINKIQQTGIELIQQTKITDKSSEKFIRTGISDQKFEQVKKKAEENGWFFVAKKGKNLNNRMRSDAILQAQINTNGVASINQVDSEWLDTNDGEEIWLIYFTLKDIKIKTKIINENKSGLDRIKFHFDKLFGPDLKFNINRDPNNPERDRIDVRGSQQDLMNFGSELGGEKMEGYEVFWTQDDDRGEIVRIVKSDSINEKKKKDDRCTRIAKRKFDTWPSAYASGAVVRCRKGKIWKGIK